MCTPKKILLSIFVVILIAFAIVMIFRSGTFFKGQLFLANEGISVFPISDDKPPYPVFSLCEIKEDCNKKIIFKFQLENNKYINQLSLENAKIKDESGANKPVFLTEDSGKTVFILKAGDLKGVSVNPSPSTLQIGDKEALYVKGTTGITFLATEGKYDFFNNGVLFGTGDNEEIIYNIQVETHELVSGDGGKILTALPDFYTIGSEFTQFNLDLVSGINKKIATRLDTSNAPWYIIIASQSIIPDFVRTWDRTSAGNSYISVGNVAPKFGLNFELIYRNCASKGAKPNCYDNQSTKDAITTIMAHELTHVYEYKSVTNKVKNAIPYLESLAELNTITLNSSSLDAAAWAKVNAKYKDTEKCKSITDVYKSGMCMLQYFKAEINDSNFKKFFNLTKNYDFGGANFCSSWFSVMQEVTGKDLADMKADFDSTICI